MTASKPVRRWAAVRLWQQTDAAGAPVAREFLQHVPLRRASYYDAFDLLETFLRPLRPVRTADPTVFSYSDPARGSGMLRVEGLDGSRVDELVEMVQLDELSRAVGMVEPHPLHSMRVTNRFYFHSPVYGIIAIGALAMTFIIGGVVGVVRTGEPLLLLFWLLAVPPVVPLRRYARRYPWWRAVRAEVRRRGERMPSTLQADH